MKPKERKVATSPDPLVLTASGLSDSAKFGAIIPTKRFINDTKTTVTTKKNVKTTTRFSAKPIREPPKNPTGIEKKIKEEAKRLFGISNFSFFRGRENKNHAVRFSFAIRG